MIDHVHTCLYGWTFLTLKFESKPVCNIQHDPQLYFYCTTFGHTFLNASVHWEVSFVMDTMVVGRGHNLTTHVNVRTIHRQFVFALTLAHYGMGAQNIRVLVYIESCCHQAWWHRLITNGSNFVFRNNICMITYMQKVKMRLQISHATPAIGRKTQEK